MIIYKYLIQPRTVLSLPKEAKVLSVQIQHGEPTMWVILDPDDVNKIDRVFMAIPTGADFEFNNIEYLATVQLPNGLVFHIFEILHHD